MHWMYNQTKQPEAAPVHKEYNVGKVCSLVCVGSILQSCSIVTQGQ